VAFRNATISNIPIIFSTSPGIGIDLQNTDIPHTPRSSVEVLTETIVGTEEVEGIPLDIDLIPDSNELMTLTIMIGTKLLVINQL
jgi:hypothetical protein